MEGNADCVVEKQRERLQQNLLLAVKECQSRYGGRTELATELESTVSSVCFCLEVILSHGLRQNSLNRCNTLFKNVSQKLKDEPKLSFWNCICHILSKHEQDRYTSLRNVKTDYGRGRAWLRSALNEKSLDRYLRSLISYAELLNQYYEPWAFLRDQEKSNVLPTAAFGLAPILFAISIDKSELDNDKNANSSYSSLNSEQIIMATSADIMKIDNARKNIPSSIVTFDESNSDTEQDIALQSNPDYEQKKSQEISEPVEVAVDAIESIEEETSSCADDECDDNTNAGLRPLEAQDMEVLIPLSTEVPPSMANSTSSLFSNSVSEDAISIESGDELGYQRAYETTKQQLKQQIAVTKDLETRVQELTRENGVLKHQLRRYVSAVQMLKEEDAAHEVQMYERKLVQVAEMHGELMELNSRLTKMLLSKDEVINRLEKELIDLRGPLPSTVPHNALVSLYIPSVFLSGKFADPHHVYQVHVRLNSEEWNIYRRYSQFYSFHQRTKKDYAAVTAFNFPPKKTIGNRGPNFVEDRRLKLQTYLRQLIHFLIAQDHILASNLTKSLFISRIPFFSDRYKGTEENSRSRNIFSNCVQTPDVNSDDNSSYYNGL